MVLVYILRTVTESDSGDSAKKAKPCRRHAGWYMCKQINMFSICDRSILEVISARVLSALRLCVTSVKWLWATVIIFKLRRVIGHCRGCLHVKRHPK